VTTRGAPPAENPYAAEERRERRAKSGLPDLAAHEPNSETSEFGRLRYGLAFGGAILLHASTAFSLVYWEPPEPIAPPGEMVITLNLEAAAMSDAKEDRAGMKDQSVEQTPPQPPTPPEEETKDEEAVEEIEPTPEPIVEEEIAEVPKAKEAEVVIAPKEEKKKKEQKPKPKPAAPSQAAASSAKPKANVSGTGASASPSEINAYTSRVRAAIEQRKSKPPSAGNASGTAHYYVVISRSGAITSVRLSRSSGTPSLDGAARSAVMSASIPPIPEGIPAPITFGVPIRFY
jgi:periplasmic protein TonB